MNAAATTRVDWNETGDAGQWATAAANEIANTLNHALAKQKRAQLLLSGGTTPAPVYERLAYIDLDWPRVDVGLVDERWLAADDPNRNTLLVREHLLRGCAADARFQAFDGDALEGAVADANLREARADIVVLGMGGDGHTASLFPGMRGLAEALASPQPYVAVDASGCPGAGAWPRRISLTPAGLAPASARLLLIRGEDKRALLQRALAGDDALELPVRIAFTTPGARLRVHWCP
ncbi:MAG: 6-phosphogluconolactonase [Thermomonas sp.]